MGCRGKVCGLRWSVCGCSGSLGSCLCGLLWSEAVFRICGSSVNSGKEKELKNEGGRREGETVVETEGAGEEPNLT